jgi:hypothetical protein
MFISMQVRSVKETDAYALKYKGGMALHQCKFGWWLASPTFQSNRHGNRETWHKDQLGRKVGKPGQDGPTTKKALLTRLWTVPVTCRSIQRTFSEQGYPKKGKTPLEEGGFASSVSGQPKGQNGRRTALYVKLPT